MTDKQVADINKLVDECKHRAAFDVCALQVLPCSRVIDKGTCPIITDYLKKEINNNG